jgi:hypothetical protein
MPGLRQTPEEISMNTFAKSALVLGTVGALALGSMTASEARKARWVAGAVGVAAGVAIGAAAANSAYFNGGYYYAPGYAYEPAYDGYAYAPGYDAYAYEPAYTYAPAPAYVPAPAYGYYGYGRPDLSTQSAPRHYDAGYGYNSNTLAPWQDRRMQGID